MRPRFTLVALLGVLSLAVPSLAGPGASLAVRNHPNENEPQPSATTGQDNGNPQGGDQFNKNNSNEPNPYEPNGPNPYAPDPSNPDAPNVDSAQVGPQDSKTPTTKTATPTGDTAPHSSDTATNKGDTATNTASTKGHHTKSTDAGVSPSSPLYKLPTDFPSLVDPATMTDLGVMETGKTTATGSALGAGQTADTTNDGTDVAINGTDAALNGIDKDGTSANGTASADSKAQAKHSNNTGLIAGVVVGVVVGLALLAALLYFFLRKKRADNMYDGEKETRESLVMDHNASSKAYEAAANPGGNGGYHSVSSSYGSSGGSPTAFLAAGGAAGMGRNPYRSSIQSMPEGEEARRALEDSIAADAFERAKAQANSKAARDVAAETYRAPEGGGQRETDAADQAPPYWLTAGEEFGDDKQRRG